MARKTAQEKLNEMFAENEETRKAVHSLVEASYDAHKNYAHACGYLESMMGEVLMELPKAKRAKYREQLLGSSATIKRLMGV